MEEPLSPMARLFQSPGTDNCIITIIGFLTKINVDVILVDLKHNVCKHPRFSSKLGEDGTKWIKTEVNIEDHLVVPNTDYEEIGEDGDGFVDDYISHLTVTPLDRSRPLWDIHILNNKTSEAEAIVVIRSHHSLGDGMSLMSLLVVSTRKTSNLEEFPTIPRLQRRATASLDLQNKNLFMKFILSMCNALRLIWNTVVDLLLIFATLFFLKDTETPLHGRLGTNTRSQLRRFYHQTISLDDIKLIKNALNMTINDVLLGVTQAALSRYMNCQYGKRNDEGGKSISNLNYLPKGIRCRAGVAVNLRSEVGIQSLADMMCKGSKCRWGNYVSAFLFPFSIGLEIDPLIYLSKVKSTMDRKKNSLAATILYLFIKLILNIFGAKVGAVIFKRSCSNTTTCVSNIVGPTDDVSYKGHPVAYIALSGYGHSQALLIHFLSYAKKMVITIAVDPTVIRDPQKLCDEIEDSLKAMKDALTQRGLI